MGVHLYFPGPSPHPVQTVLALTHQLPCWGEVLSLLHVDTREPSTWVLPSLARCHFLKEVLPGTRTVTIHPYEWLFFLIRLGPVRQSAHDVAVFPSL